MIWQEHQDVVHVLEETGHDFGPRPNSKCTAGETSLGCGSSECIGLVFLIQNHATIWKTKQKT